MLTKSRDQAAELARPIEAEDWAGEVRVRDDAKAISRALGTSREGQGLVSVWWD